MVDLLNHFRKTNYWLAAFFVWILSFLILPESKWVNNLTYILLFIPLLLTISRKELGLLISNGSIILLMILCLVLAGTAFFHGEPLRQLKYGLMVVMFYLAATRLPHLRTEDVWKYSWLMFLMLVAYVVINMGIRFADGTWQPGARLVYLTGRVENPIFAADLLALFLAAITVTSISLRTFRSLILAHLLALVLCIFVLQSRSMLPAWAVIVLLTAFQSAFRSKESIYPILTSAGLVLFVVYCLFFTELGSLILERGDSYRLEIWQGYILQTFNCGILFGCGMDHPFQFITRDGLEISHAHNIYIAQLFKGGLLALSALIAMILWGLWAGLKKNHWAAWMLAAGATALFFDGSSIITSPNEIWLLLHLPLALLSAPNQHMQHS
jgi:O-antigen ligase